MTPLNSGDTLHGQAHVVFRDSGQPGARAQIVAAVGGLHFSVERVLIRKIMQQAGHKPAKAFPFPDPIQRQLRVGRQQIAAATMVVFAQNPPQVMLPTY